MKTKIGFKPLIAIVLLSSSSCMHQSIRQQFNFKGTVKAGERFEKRFGNDFIFKLKPWEFGWLIQVYEQGREDNLSELTPSIHFTNPCWIEGWHFRNEENTKANRGEVNAPQYEREFIFSPEADRTFDIHSVTMEDVKRFKSFGSGVLYIDKLKLSPPERGHQANILEMQFHCALSFPHHSIKPGRKL